MRAAQFYLKLKPEELLEYYQGRKRFVRVRTYQGYSIQFRAEHLRRWVTPEGIHGEFEIRFDQHNKFAGLDQYRSFIAAQPSGAGQQSKTEATATPLRRQRGFKTSI